MIRAADWAPTGASVGPHGPGLRGRQRARTDEWIGRIEDVTEEQAHLNRAVARSPIRHDGVGAHRDGRRRPRLPAVDGPTVLASNCERLCDAAACAVSTPDRGRYKLPLLLLHPLITRAVRPRPKRPLTPVPPSENDGRWGHPPRGAGRSRPALARVAAVRTGSGGIGTCSKTVAAQLAQALSRAQLLEQSRSTARLLQRTLLPERLPCVAGLEVAARYRAPTGSDVGGDWYDVLQLSAGSDGGEKVALVLGDVMGRGVRAAGTMGQVRNALRGIAVVDPSPWGCSPGWTGSSPPSTRTRSPRWSSPSWTPVPGELHVGNAGHLPPLMMRADGRSGQLDDGASTPLGVPTERVACKGTIAARR